LVVDAWLAEEQYAHVAEDGHKQLGLVFEQRRDINSGEPLRRAGNTHSPPSLPLLRHFVDVSWSTAPALQRIGLCERGPNKAHASQGSVC